jgi:hypothetical protein
LVRIPYFHKDDDDILGINPLFSIFSTLNTTQSVTIIIL